MEKRWTIAMVATTLMLAGVAQAASETAQKARAVVAANQESVVWVTAAIKVELSASNYPSKTQESTVTVLGTIIDDSGLTVVSYKNIDPVGAYEGRTMNIGGQMVKISAKTEHSDLKIVLSNGTEVPADIVLKDPDLDLAFIKPRADSPEAKGAKFSAVKMAKAPKLELLDDLVCIGRLSRALNQEAVANLSEVSAIVTKPRTYIFGGRFIGTPAFAIDGTAVGITVAYEIPGDVQKMQTATVIIPAEDVLKVAQQAKTAKPIVASQPASAPAASAPAAAPATPPVIE